MTTKTDITQEHAAVEADRSNHIGGVTEMVPSDDLHTLQSLLDWAEEQICLHEETHRGGAIWEIRDQCGAKWADDEGGKPEFQWPEPIVKARALLDRYGNGQPAASPEGSLADSIGFCSFDPDDRFYHASDRTWWRRADDGMLVRAEAPQPDASAEQNTHIDDDAVDHFAAAMKAKLAQARAKGRHGWQECDPSDLSQMLRAHVEKGDPRDVANFCMFLWSLGQPISAAPVAQEPVAFLCRECDEEGWSTYVVMPHEVPSTGEFLHVEPLYAAPVAAQAQPSISPNVDDLDRVATILNRHEAGGIGLWGVVEEIIDAFGARFYPSAQDRENAGDPLQGAANWLLEVIENCRPVDLQNRLFIGYNRASRLIDAARAGDKS